MSGRIPSEEEFDAAKSAIKEVDEEIKKEEEGRPAEVVVQKLSFDPASENKQRIEDLKEENEELRKTIKELKKDLDGRVKKVEEELEDLGKIVNKENSK